MLRPVRLSSCVRASNPRTKPRHVIHCLSFSSTSASTSSSSSSTTSSRPLSPPTTLPPPPAASHTNPLDFQAAQDGEEGVALRGPDFVTLREPENLYRRTRPEHSRVFEWGVGNKFRADSKNRFMPVHKPHPKEIVVRNDYYDSPSKNMFFEDHNEQWEVLFYQDYKWHAKPFPVKKFGLERAKREALAFLEEKKDFLEDWNAAATKDQEKDFIDPRLRIPERTVFGTHDFAAGAHPEYSRPVPRIGEGDPTVDAPARIGPGVVSNDAVAKAGAKEMISAETTSATSSVLPAQEESAATHPPLYSCAYSSALKKFSGTFAAERRDAKLEARAGSAIARAAISRQISEKRAMFTEKELHSDPTVPIEFDARMQGWTVFYYDESGRPKTKCYSARKWGNQVARDKALALYQERGLGLG
ncbi:unnamed protein product [Amoebophrya sp. A120]|nr:unnamed protein product [Amoebophrya sp. A120]|eukprot:GSA120T00010859001.1